ncbi:MAG: hypothetical protein RIR62_607 [Pseudomonadota bacterium]|jgi:chemotaxis protein methyltransferase CheR
MASLAPRTESYSDRFRALIRSITGISLPAAKVHLIDQRLRRRVTAFGLPDTESYLRQLLDGEGMEAELRLVIDLITTNTTSFFREPEHFDILAGTILPERLARARAGQVPRLKIWSAAASEGAEAYTAAMVLAEEQRRGRRFDYAILGTDLSQRMIERAAAAIYATEQMASVPPDYARRYVLSAGHPSVSGKVRIVPELRRNVRFSILNLMDATYPVARDVDVIFLRNILIYFDPAEKERVIRQLAAHLAPGGYLIVGHSESMIVRHPDLTQVRPTVFKKGEPRP